MLPTAPAQALHQGTRDVFAALHRVERAIEPWRDAAPRREISPRCGAASGLPTKVFDLLNGTPI